MNLSDRQKQIIDVSLALIAEKGIQGLTIKNLARKIGFSESAIYRHYENKIEILLAILDYFQETTNQMLEQEGSITSSTMETMLLIFQRQFQTFSNSTTLVSVIFSEELFRNEKLLFRKVSEIMNSTSEKLTKIIRTGQEKGEIRTDIEASYLSIILIGSLQLFVKQWHMANYSFDLVNKGKELTNAIHTLIKKN